MGEKNLFETTGVFSIVLFVVLKTSFFKVKSCISIVGFVDNLTNDLELTSTTAGPGASFIGGVLDAALGTATYVNRPRTFGVNLTVRY